MVELEDERSSLGVGLPPGSLVYVGDERGGRVKLHIIDYSEGGYEERETENVEDCFGYKDTDTVTWINVNGVHEPRIIDAIGRHYGIHPLIQEDILNTEARPKFEDSEGYLFISLKMLSYSQRRMEVDSEQVSLILGPGYVISFQEREGDVFNSIRERIRSGKGRIRHLGADYLAYALIDAVVDNYFVLLETIGERIEDVEVELIKSPEPEVLETVYSLKREMIALRKSVWPLREIVNGLERGESELVSENTQMYLRDVYDHTIQIIDTIESQRDMASSLMDLYMSSVSNRMNEVMKVLTIIATIFIPLTFIAGVYGMNFQENGGENPLNMPELNWYWGYPMVWAVMAVLAAVMVLYFKRKGWL